MRAEFIHRRSADRLRHLLAQFPAVGLVGPRQVGKTELARRLFQSDPDCIFLDLEDPRDLSRLEDPMLYFESLPEARFVIDEVQRLPVLFPALRVLIDKDRRPGRFMLLGSAAPDLLRHSAESLAGRIAYHRLHPFDIEELSPTQAMMPLWNRGGFPLSFLAQDDDQSTEWRRQYLSAVVERDLPLLGLASSQSSLRRFLSMLAHLHGQTLNKSILSRNMGWSLPMVDKHLDVLQSAFLISLVPAWHTNGGKRLVRSPKLFLSDSGLLHALLGISGIENLMGHPALGASWEGFVFEQLDALKRPDDALFHYRTQDGTEGDLVLVRNNQALALFECKANSAPRLNRGNTIAAADLQVRQRFIVAPISDSFPQREGFRVIGPMDLAEQLKSL